MKAIVPHHINAKPEHLDGNNGLGRYVLLTGSDFRARQISEYFNHLDVLEHPRQHNLYLGALPTSAGSIDVAAVSTGMGGPSADIIINELIQLGASRFLRIGTAGSLQPEQIHVGDVVIATSAVRDDKASWDYIYREYPAIASMECMLATRRALKHFNGQLNAYFGIIHSKSSLFAREMGLSLLPENKEYMQALQQAGVLASEMECAQLFILASLMSARLKKTILSGGILAIIGDKTAFSNNEKRINNVMKNAIELGVRSIEELAKEDGILVSVLDS